MMGLFTSAANAYFTYKFLRLLTQKWEDTEAYELGIVDENGKALKKVSELRTTEERNAYSVFNRLVFNVKRILGKLPFGNSRLASYAAAMYLIKEHGVDAAEAEKILKEKFNVEADVLTEENQPWFIRDDVLPTGTYTLINDIPSPDTGEIIAKAGTKVAIEGHQYPIDEIFGHRIYEARHIITRSDIFITPMDITK
jgi:hypothetical protein